MLLEVPSPSDITRIEEARALVRMSPILLERTILEWLLSCHAAGIHPQTVINRAIPTLKPYEGPK